MLFLGLFEISKSELYIQALGQVALQGLKTVKIGLAQVLSEMIVYLCPTCAG